MTSLRSYIEEQIAADPRFATELAEAKAELELGLGLARLREALGLTQREVAERAGIAQSAVACYEKAGRTPTVLTLWRFAQALDAEIILGPANTVTVRPREWGSSRPTPTENGHHDERATRDNADQRTPVAG